MWIFFLSPLNIYVNGENRPDNIKLFRNWNHPDSLQLSREFGTIWS